MESSFQLHNIILCGFKCLWHWIAWFPHWVTSNALIWMHLGQTHRAPVYSPWLISYAANSISWLTTQKDDHSSLFENMNEEKQDLNNVHLASLLKSSIICWDSERSPSCLLERWYQWKLISQFWGFYIFNWKLFNKMAGCMVPTTVKDRWPNLPTINQFLT